MSQSSLPKSPSPSLPLTRLTTLLSNACIAALFLLFAYAALQNWRTNSDARMLILAFQELLIVGLVVTRHPSTHETRSPWDWTIAILGTIAPLFLRPGGTHLPMLLTIGLGIQLVGSVLSTIAVWNLWRSFGIIAALRTVRTKGFYGVVRHPLYASYLVSYFGFILANPTLLNISLIAFSMACQYMRAIAEERILMTDPAYCDYMQKVRYRFIPFVF